MYSLCRRALLKPPCRNSRFLTTWACIIQLSYLLETGISRTTIFRPYVTCCQNSLNRNKWVLIREFEDGRVVSVFMFLSFSGEAECVHSTIKPKQIIKWARDTSTRPLYRPLSLTFSLDMYF